MSQTFTRRSFLHTAAVGGASLAIAARDQETIPDQAPAPRFSLCLNTSTIRPASLLDKVRIAAEVGYDAIELWMDDLERYEAEGGDVAALGRQIADSGLKVPNVIGLWNAMPAGEEEWRASLEASQRRMALARAAGAEHVAALPTPDRADIDLRRATEQYRELLRIGRENGIRVAFEFVGFFQGIHRLGQAAAVALDADDKDASLIMDSFHLYRGGSGFGGVRHLQASFIADFHINDVPVEPPVHALGDEHRIFPGDGILPLRALIQDLVTIGYAGPLSLECFNREHWQQDPRQVAETGLRKLRALVA